MAIVRPRTTLLLVALAGLLALVAPSRLVPPAAAADDEIPWQLRQDLAAALKSKADALWKEKNEAGQSYQRGSFSKKFRKIDDSTYESVFFKDTAGPDRMKTERYLVTLTGSGAKWQVTGEVPHGAYEKLIRDVPGDETFHRFDSFTFEREGLSVSIGSGSLVVDYELGEPRRFLFNGQNVRYGYTPPADLPGEHGQVWTHLARLNPDDFAFTAEGVILSCDATTCKRFLGDAFQGVRDTTRDELDKALVSYYDEEIKKERDARRENPFGGFHLPDEADERRYSLALKKQGKDQWISMSYNNLAPWEVNVWVSGFGRVIGYPSAETRAAGVDPYELEMRDDWLARQYEVVALQGAVEVATEDAELLRADISFTIRMLKEAQEIYFALGTFDEVDRKGKNAAITVNSLSDGNDEPLVYVRLNPTTGLVVLPAAVPAGTEVVVRMGYETTGSIYKETPSYSYVDRDSWLPFVRYEDKIKDFDLEVTVPSKFKAVSVGTSVSEKRSGDGTTTTWQGQDVHFPTIIFGIYVEDKPTTVAAKKDGTEIPVTIHVDKDHMRDWQIVPKSLRPLAAQAVNALNIYRELYDWDYPHGKLDLVNDTRCVGAQSPDSIVYVGGCVFFNEATLAEMFGQELGDMTSQEVAEFVDSLIAHEVGHQWWGGVVGNRSSRHYWFVESLAEYSSALYMEIVASEGYQKPEKGRKAYMELVDTWRKMIYEADLMNSVQNSLMGYLGESGRPRYTLNYAKGPYAFHVLRTTFGDEKFFAFLEALMQELGGKNIVTRDIQRVAEQSFGGTMEWFFDQWIRGVGIPEYSFHYTTRPDEQGTYIVEGTIRQRVVVGKKKLPLEGVYYRGLVPISVLGKDKQEYSKPWLVEGPETKFALKVPAQPVEVAFNRNGEILSHPVLVNTGW